MAPDGTGGSMWPRFASPQTNFSHYVELQIRQHDYRDAVADFIQACLEYRNRTNGRGTMHVHPGLRICPKRPAPAPCTPSRARLFLIGRQSNPRQPRPARSRRRRRTWERTELT